MHVNALSNFFAEALPAAAADVYDSGYMLQVRSRFADGASGKEDFQPLLAALKSLGFKLVQQDAANRMFVAWVFQKKGGVKPAAAAAIDWPTLRACVYKKR